MISVRHIGRLDTNKFLLVFCHATGFCQDTWRPVVQHLDSSMSNLTFGGTAVSFDFSGHGENRCRHVDPTQWGQFCVEDIQKAISAFQKQYFPLNKFVRVVAVGHSMGGAACLLAQQAEPHLFSDLICIEPVVMPPTDISSGEGENYLALRAAKRRSRFASVDEARSYFSSKPLFSSWDKSALEGYVQGGLCVSPTGGVELACKPEFEAKIYQGRHRAWDKLPTTAAKGNTTIICGSDSRHLDAFGMPTQELFAAISQRLPRARLLVIERASHFVPMEKPDCISEAICAALHSPLVG